MCNRPVRGEAKGGRGWRQPQDTPARAAARFTDGREMEDGGGGLGAPAGCNSTCSLCACPASLQCLICLKRGIRPAPSFCGVACYREHWASHRNHHHEAAAAAAANSYGAASARWELCGSWGEVGSRTLGVGEAKRVRGQRRQGTRKVLCVCVYIHT